MNAKQTNRAKYPELAKFMDALKARFPNARVVKLREHRNEHDHIQNMEEYR